MSNDKYKIIREGFSIEHNLETCFVVSNGYFAVRGTTEELYENEFPGFYAAGVFDKGSSQVCELANLPYPFGLRIYINRELLDLRVCKIEHYIRELDMKRGVYSREFRVTDPSGRTVSFSTIRFASMAVRNIGLADYKITCENFNGVVNIEAFIEANVYNAKNNPNERVRHFTGTIDNTPDHLYIECKTGRGAYTIGIASKTAVKSMENAVQLSSYQRDFGSFTAQYLEFEVAPSAVIELERFIAVCTSREVSDVEARTRLYLNTAASTGGESLLGAHEKEMRRIWELADIEIEGDLESDRALRFCIYNLISCVNPCDEHISIGAKGLHGEGYKGHVFWDTEVFTLPFFIYTLPKYARTLLSYRYHKLDSARKNAALGGYMGARYPWESADAGLEETPRWGFDYKGNRVRIWTGDIELHITGDIAYALREYVRASGDEHFFMTQAAEIILETARFWVSRLEYNASHDRYEISCVIGPDEFHEHVDNSAFTNSLAKWNIDYALECAEKLAEHEDFKVLCKKTGLTSEELQIWKKAADKIYIPKSENGKLIEQFEGYFELEDRIVTEFDSNHMPVWPGDVDIAALNKYTLVKQADVVMLMHMLSDQFSLDTMTENYIYYDMRTMHKSSLGPSMYALMGVKTGQYDKAYANFYRTVMTDLSDNQGNTSQGIHIASAGGAWCAMFYGFCGVSVDADGCLNINPWLPEKWKSVKLNFNFQERRLALRISGADTSIERISGAPGLKIKVNNKEITV